MKLVLALVYRKNIGVTNKIIIHNKEQIFSMMDEYFFSFFFSFGTVYFSLSLLLLNTPLNAVMKI